MSLVRARSRSGLVALAVGALLVATVTAPVADLLHSPDAASAAPALAATELPSPAVTSLETGRLDVFTRSSGGDLLHRYRPAGGSWTRTVNLGGDLAIAAGGRVLGPRAARRVRARHRRSRCGSGTLTVAGGWGGWVALGGTVTSAPAATSWGPGRLDVFVRGTDSGLWKTLLLIGGRAGRPGSALAGTLTSSPAGRDVGLAGRLDVFVRGTDNGRLAAVVHRRLPGRTTWIAAGRRRWRRSRQRPRPVTGVIDVAVPRARPAGAT